MPRGLDKQGIIAVVLLLVVVAVAGWLLLGNNGQDGGKVKIDTMEAKSIAAAVLAEDLQPDLSTESQGVMLVTKGGGSGWQFYQSQADQQTEIRDAEGNLLPSVPTGMGEGGTLSLELASPSTQSLQAALRQKLSDNQVQVRPYQTGWQLVSNKIVSGIIYQSSGTTVIPGLFLRRYCSEMEQSGNGPLKTSCQVSAAA